MLNEIENIRALVLQHNFDLELSESEENDLFCIRKALIHKIDYLLTYDFSKLLWILYRIDVKEEKSKELLYEIRTANFRNACRLNHRTSNGESKNAGSYRQQ